MVRSAVAGGLVLLAACSSVPSFPEHAEQYGRTESMTADWNDIDAAVDLAASESELMIQSAGADNPDERIYLLRSIRDEPVWLRVRRPAGQDESASLELTARVGRFGDLAREREFLSNLRRRLGQLHGVGTHPID